MKFRLNGWTIGAAVLSIGAAVFGVFKGIADDAKKSEENKAYLKTLFDDYTAGRENEEN